MNCRNCKHYEKCDKVYMHVTLQRVCSKFKKKVKVINNGK